MEYMQAVSTHLDFKLQFTNGKLGYLLLTRYGAVSNCPVALFCTVARASWNCAKRE